jgi:hypothetical protein
VSTLVARAGDGLRAAVDDAKRRSRLNVAVVSVCAVVLALGPLALTLTRAESYQSSSTISLAAGNTPATLPASPSKLLSDALDVHDLQRAIARTATWLQNPADLPRHVTVTETRQDGRQAFVITGSGPTSDEARQLVQATTAQLATAGNVASILIRNAELQRVQGALRAAGQTAAESRALRERRAALARALRTNQPVFAPNAAAPTGERERLGDRILGALPGTRPARPNPVWAAVAGVALALAFGLWVLVLSAGGRRRESGVPG